MSLRSQLESILFIAAKPLAVSDLVKVSGAKQKEIEEELEKMITFYKEQESGWQLLASNGKYQIATAPDNAEMVKKFLAEEVNGELSRPSLEALTIIAYRGPISKSDLERIRGVNCSLILRNLLIRGLIEEKFSKEKQENYYTVTLDFVRFLGLSEVRELPDYDKLSKDDTLTKVLEESSAL
ncbi:MAG: SMC-Scp complex subunit ScpB [Planctomycetes bacterium]|jgi:segregation and condensation protein B|nr:SMC-Scp complex subunit ScpB [Planctomycetota bacterium]